MIDTSAWPESLKRIAELIGAGPALKLVAAYGGLEVYVPKRLPEDHPLARTIGLKAARRLMKAYSGEKVEVPILRSARALKRRIAEAKGGTNEVARRLGVTARYVRYVRGRQAGDPRQMDLFGEG